MDYIKTFISGNPCPVVEFMDVDLDNGIVIDGAEAYDVICPVSSVTGCRENPLALLKTLLNDPAKSRALDAIFQELPVVNSDVKGVSYDDMLASLQSVFNSGTPYDDDKFAQRLMSISEDLLKSQGIEKPIEKVELAPSADPALSAE